MTTYHHDDELHDDDKPVGRVLSRREVLKLISGGSAALVAGMSLPQIVSAQSEATEAATAFPSCVVRPEVTEGPYFVDEQMNRFDLRVDPRDNSVKTGLPFLLVYNVSDVTGGQCALLEGAQVDVWHCDADGVYSGVNDPGFDTDGEQWLRGYQITDENGIAQFLTIIPGWYSGRAVHIHFKIRTETEDGESYEFTSQFFFDPELIEELYSEEPYTDRGLPNTPNEVDFIYQQTDGVMTLDVTEMTEEQLEVLVETWAAAQEEEDTTAEGTELGITRAYMATFTVGLDLSDASVGARDGAGGRR